VLVVDEYRPMCDMIAAVLRPRGYRVLTAASGGEAKALAKASAVIDLLLMDLELPQKWGDGLADWFRATRPTTRILFMSAKDMVRAPEPFIAKPFHIEALIGKVREVLNHSFAEAAA
jgi:DNA-binding response OmpR family regulator